MPDAYNGFEYTFKSRTLNADGALFDCRLLVVAKDVHEAALIARRMIRETLLIDSGPEVLVRLLDHLRTIVAAARKAGIKIFFVPHRCWQLRKYEGFL